MSFHRFFGTLSRLQASELRLEQRRPPQRPRRPPKQPKTKIQDKCHVFILFVAFNCLPSLRKYKYFRMMPWRLPQTAGGHQRPLLEAAIFECLNYFHYIGMLYVLSWVICHDKSITSIRIEIRIAEAALEDAEATRRLQWPNAGIISIIQACYISLQGLLGMLSRLDGLELFGATEVVLEAAEAVKGSFHVRSPTPGSHHIRF